MRSKSILVLTVAAAFMVAWLSLRMWCGDDRTVWLASCTMGAWAPLIAALLFYYVRVVGKRENSVFAAWLVRALGMHCVLLWMVGITDIVRGSPIVQQEGGSITEVIGPLSLFAFFPVFALFVGAMDWVVGLAKKLTPKTVRAAMPGERSSLVIPFRGMVWIAEHQPITKMPLMPIGIGAFLMVMTFVVGSVSSVSLWIMALSAFVLAWVSHRNHRAVAPSALVQVCVSAVVVMVSSPWQQLQFLPMVKSSVLPWVALCGVGLYLFATELLLRMRRTLSWLA